MPEQLTIIVQNANQQNNAGCDTVFGFVAILLTLSVEAILWLLHICQLDANLYF